MQKFDKKKIIIRDLRPSGKNMNLEQVLNSFIVLWAVIDPIGTVPVFLAATKRFDRAEKNKIALRATLVAFFVLLFFLLAGESLLKHLGVPLPAFQVSGGVILLLFALSMIFGSSKPEEELALVRSGKETAIFPIAMPSIASPGAILAIILLTDNSRHSILEQTGMAFIMGAVLLSTYFLMSNSEKILNVIGNSGAIIISKIMGMVLASIASTNILLGIKEFFAIGP